VLNDGDKAASPHPPRPEARRSPNSAGSAATTCGDVGILQALTEVQENDGRRVDDEPEPRVSLGVADTLRGIAAQLRFNLRRGDQLLALADGFERFGRRLLPSTGVLDLAGVSAFAFDYVSDDRWYYVPDSRRCGYVLRVAAHIEFSGQARRGGANRRGTIQEGDGAGGAA
jgi:hypothetical protein